MARVKQKEKDNRTRKQMRQNEYWNWITCIILDHQPHVGPMQRKATVYNPTIVVILGVVYAFVSVFLLKAVFLLWTDLSKAWKLASVKKNVLKE